MAWSHAGIGGVMLSDLKLIHVDEWMKSLRTRGLGDRTVEYAQSVLRRAMQFALEWDQPEDRQGAGGAPLCSRTKYPRGECVSSDGHGAHADLQHEKTSMAVRYRPHW